MCNFLFYQLPRFLLNEAMLTKQLNVELPEAEARRIKKDAVELGVTLNEYALRAFQAFLAKNKAQRGCHFAKRKIMGRKISLK